MITYFLPDPGLHGGVKVGCQFAELLAEAGARVVVALPDGRAPTWFACRAPVVDEASALAGLGAGDWAMLSWPPHYPTLRDTPARLVNHAQGVTDLEAIFADPRVLLLTCWAAAADHVRRDFGRQPIEVGLAISDAFYFSGEVKRAARVAFMPRRGRAIADACIAAVPACEYVAIDGCPEQAVAAWLKSADIYLATAVNEDFGLPALEAMAAGCVVVSVPVRGGMEYLAPGVNCLLAAPEALPETLDWITRPAQAVQRQRLRHAGLATAHRYRRSQQRRRLAALLRGPLACLVH